MGIESHALDRSGEKKDRVSSLLQEIGDTRERMESEAHTFIEAAKNFSLEWIQRELSTKIPHQKDEGYSGDIETGKDGLNELLHPESLLFRISEIVEAQLNRDEFWIHRRKIPHADNSYDYIEFKKEKLRRDLTSSIRMVLGCAAEIFADMKEENSENKIWVKERGRRKYICILRFSDEMTASLQRYFAMLEYLFALEYEIKEIKKGAEDKGS